MGTILFLIGFPIIIALILLVSKEDKVRDIVVKIAAFEMCIRDRDHSQQSFCS